MEQQKQKLPMEVTEQVDIIKFTDGQPVYQPDTVATEMALELFVDGILLKTLYATPNHLQELAVGYLLARHKISSYRDIARLRMVPKNTGSQQPVYQAQIELEEGIGAFSRGLIKPIYSLDKVSTEDINSYLAEFGLDIPGVNAVMHSFIERSSVFKATGAVHSCGLAYGQQLLFFTEDVARYNAFNKTIGHFAMTGGRQNAENARYLLVSGRVSGEMIEQCAAQGIPLILSKSAPLSRSVALAKQYKIGLFGFIRGNSFNVYNL